MPDWGQLARNLAYGAIHRPAQFVRWFGNQFEGYAAPLGQELVGLANEVEFEAGQQLQPFVPPMPQVSLPPPPPPSPHRLPYCHPWTFHPSPGPTHGYGGIYIWVSDAGISCETPPGVQTGPGWGPGFWEPVYVPPPPIGP